LYAVKLCDGNAVNKRGLRGASMQAVVRWGARGLSPTCCRFAPPPAKILALVAKNLAWPALHESCCFICPLLSKYRHSNSQCCSHAFFTVHHRL